MQINPLFLAALQQQQQYQQQQQTPGQQPTQAATMNFDQVKAQLDLLRQLSNANQGPPRS
jgi:H/ACA ribonucleoprotein complex non-core subunit NAF1